MTQGGQNQGISSPRDDAQEYVAVAVKVPSKAALGTTNQHALFEKAETEERSAFHLYQWYNI